MFNTSKLYFSHFPSQKITPFSYIFVFFLFLKTKLANKTLVLNLPEEIYNEVEFVPPGFLYSCWQRGLDFINFVERLKKILDIKVFWLDEEEIINLPQRLNLILKLKKQKQKTKRFQEFVKSYKGKIFVVNSLRGVV